MAKTLILSIDISLFMVLFLFGFALEVSDEGSDARPQVDPAPLCHAL